MPLLWERKLEDELVEVAFSRRRRDSIAIVVVVVVVVVLRVFQLRDLEPVT